MHRNIPSPKWNVKEKRWILQIMHKGNRKVFTSRIPKTEGRRICIEKAADWLATFDNKNPDFKFSEVWERFITDYELKHGKIEQLRKYKTLGRLYLLPSLGPKKVGELTIEDYQNLINSAKPQPRKGKNGNLYYLSGSLSKKYLKSIKDTIQAFNSWARPRKYTDLELGSELYVPSEAPTRGREILQLTDVQKIFKNPTGLWFERAIWFELLTGCRPGEVLGLQLADYDKPTGIITIRRSVNWKGQVTPGKNKNARRQIALPPLVQQIILDQIKVSKKLKSQWLFCNPIGDAGRQEALGKCWKRICTQLGINPNTTPYSLRHTFYSHTEAYMPERLIKMVFGHSEKTDGHSIYGDHMIDGELQEAADRLSVTPIYKIASEN